MKKIILLFVVLFAFVGLQAQDLGLLPNQTYRSYTGIASDTVAGTATLSKVVKVGKEYLYYYEVLVDIDTLAGGGDNAVSCILYGSNDMVNYSSITDVTFSATADTILRYTNLSATGTIPSYTLTRAAFDATADTTGLAGYWADTTTYAAAVTTVAAQTVPLENGIMWRFLKLAITGDGASARVELQAIRVKIVKIP